MGVREVLIRLRPVDASTSCVLSTSIATAWNLAQFNLHIARVSDGGVGFVSDLNFGQLANVMRATTR